MALFRITVKQNSLNYNGVRLEKGMSVEIVANSSSNPLNTNEGRQKVIEAFKNKYGTDMTKVIHSNVFEVQKM